MHATTVAPSHPCSACGGLECLCRPRFRAGQVLTETDLNCLEEYVVRKQQRHNRYLHGWGVACGMRVLCHPCPGWVTVTSGFAIGPCGEEIAIPCDHPLNVCEMIRECRTAMWKNWSCEPFAAPPCGPTTDSPEAEESWYVTVRYAEAEARGDGDCNPCGKPADCGCGCGKKAASGKCGCGKSAAATKPRPARTHSRPPAECEPNRVCEGYRLEIAPAPPRRPPTPESLIQGTFLGAIFACMKKIAAVLAKDPAKLPTPPTGATEAAAAHAKYREAVEELLADLHVGACSPAPKLPPVPRSPERADIANPTAYVAEVNEANKALTAVVVPAIRQCLCDAILPPCPDDAADPRIVLALVTTRGPECKIVDVCETRCRKQLVTVPTLEYWLSVFPALWAVVEAICCGQDPRRGAVTIMQPPAGVQPFAGGPPADAQPYAILLATFAMLRENLKSALGGPANT